MDTGCLQGGRMMLGWGCSLHFRLNGGSGQRTTVSITVNIFAQGPHGPWYTLGKREPGVKGGFPGGSVKEFAWQCRRHGSDPWPEIPHALEQQTREPQLTGLCSGAHAMKQEKPPRWEAWAPQLESSSRSPQLENSPHSNEDQQSQKNNPRLVWRFLRNFWKYFKQLLIGERSQEKPALPHPNLRLPASRARRKPFSEV